MINIISWNCAGGLKAKIDEVKNIISATNVDFFFTCEAEVKAQQEKFFEIRNYELFVANSIQLGKGRLTCHVSASVSHLFKRKPELEGD